MKHLAAHIKENISVEDLLHKVGAGTIQMFYHASWIHIQSKKIMEGNS